MRGCWGLAVPNSRPGGYCSRRGACTQCAGKAELVYCRWEGGQRIMHWRGGAQAGHCMVVLAIWTMLV